MRQRVFTRCIILFLSALALASASSAQDGFPGIKRLMSAEEFKATGLQGLSDTELKALDDWLLRYTAGDAQLLQQSSKAVRQAKKEFEVESRIVGNFTGWSGETRFQLENGQVWRQRINRTYRYAGPPNPLVRIDKNWAGYYRLTLVESGKSVGVKLEN